MTNRITKIILRGEIGDLTGKMTVASRAVMKTADDMTKAGREAEKFRHGLTGLGDSAGKLGLVAAVGVGAVVTATANYGQAISRVEAATHASTITLGRLSDAAVKAGAATVFSATEAADAITAMAKAGVSATDILHGGLKGALSLASAGELDVATAADIAATAMNQFGLAGKDIPHIADLLAAGAGKAQGEVTDFAQALKYVGPVAHQMGISIEETTGTIAELASQGILADQAGTSLRGLLTSLSSPSKQAAQEMLNLGLNLYDATGKFVGFNGVADQLHKTLGTLTNAERDQALGRLFGNEQITAARILYAGGAADVDKWTKAVNDNGYAADTAAIKLDNLKGDLEQLRGSLETALIGSGQGSQGALRGLTQEVTSAVNAFNKLPSAARSGATEALAGVALLGGAVFVFSRVVQSIAKTRQALDQLGPSGQRAGMLLRSGLQISAVIGGLDALGATIDGVFDRNLNDTNLSRSLTSLANGKVTGEIRDKFGGDLKELVEELNKATDGGLTAFNRGLVEHAPGKLKSLLKNPFDSSAGYDTAVENVNALDEALAQLVESGNAEQATALIAQFKAAGASDEAITKGFQQYTVAVENASTATDDTTTKIGWLVTAQKSATKATSQHAAAQEVSAKAMKAAQDAATKQAQSFVGLGKDLDNNKVSLHDWITELDKQAKALEQFTANAAKAEKRHLAPGLIAELKEQGTAGALRLQQLAGATETEIARANRAYRRGQKAIQDYTNIALGIPDPELSVKNQKALASIAAVRDALASLGLSNLASAGSMSIPAPRGPGQGGGKDGDPKTPYYDGGYTGDMPPGAVAGQVHGREYVFSAQATQGNVGFLENLHQSLRAQSGRSYATQTARPTSGGNVQIDYEQLARANAALRPMTGPVTVRDGRDFLRLYEDSQAKAAFT